MDFTRPERTRQLLLHPWRRQHPLLGLLSYLTIAGGASAQTGSTSYCLENAVQEGDRQGIDVEGGGSVALGIWTLGWESAELVTEVTKILLEEQLGYLTQDSGTSAVSRTGLLAMAECQLEDSVVTCSDDLFETTTHIILEVWTSQVYDWDWLYENYPDRAPDDVGSMGYVGHGGQYIPQDVLKDAVLGYGHHLEFYGSYNASWEDPSQYFDNYSSIPKETIQLCSNSTISDPSIMANVIKFAPDPGGFTDEGIGICEDGYWWLAPSCRENPEKCIPYLTVNGWLLPSALERAISYNMPLAIANMKSWEFFVAVPSTHRSLFYSWTPTLHFLSLSPVRIMFPEHDSEAYQLGDQRTARTQLALEKYTHRTIQSDAADVYSMMSAVTFTMSTIEDMLSEVVSGKTYREIACEWLLANEDTWSAWIPLATDCSEGFGLVDGDGNFLSNRSSATSCSPCIAGFFSEEIEDDDGITQRCIECPIGTYQSMWGSTTCADCEAGYYQSQPAKSACSRCEEGFFANATGQTTCWACDDGFTTRGTGFRDSSDCQCPTGAFLNQLGKCSECGDYAKCAGFGSDPEAKPGYELDSITADGFLSIFSCTQAARCPGGTLRTCVSGREGIACAKCKPNMVANADGTCRHCNGSDWVPFSTLILFICVCLLLIYISKSKHDKARQSGTIALLTTMLSQFLGLLQLMGILHQLAVAWKEPMQSVMQLFGVFGFDFELVRLGCVANFGSLSTFILKLLVLPLCSFYLILQHFIISKVFRDERTDFQSGLIGSIGTLFLAFFVMLSITAFVPFQCRQHPNSKWTVLQFESELCWEGGDHTYMVIAAMFGMSMPLSFISGVIYLLHSFPARIRADDLRYLKTFSFIFTRVKPEMRWFTLFLLLRNLFVALVLMVPNAFWQLFLMQCTFGTSLCTTLRLDPWAHSMANTLDVVGITGVLALFSLSAFFSTDTDTTALSDLALVVSLLCLTVLPFMGAWTAFRHMSRRKKQFKWFLCHQKASCGAFARLMKMTLARVDRDDIFLDSDNLHALGQLFELVKTDTETLLVLATRPLLGSPWCIGEITTAHVNCVNSILVKFPCWEPYSSSILETPGDDVVNSCPLPAEKHSDWVRLAEAGLSTERARLAVEGLEKLNLVPVTEPYTVGQVVSIANEVRHNGLSRSVSASGSVASDATRLTQSSTRLGASLTGSVVTRTTGSYLAADLESREAVAAGLILIKLLTPLWFQTPHKIPDLLDTTEHQDVAGKQIILLLTNSCFSSMRYLTVLFILSGVQIAGLTPVVASETFEYPTAHFYKALAERAATLAPARNSKNPGEALVGFVEAVFEKICKRLSPHSSIEILRSETAVIQQEVDKSPHFDPLERRHTWQHSLQKSALAASSQAEMDPLPEEAPVKANIPPAEPFYNVDSCMIDAQSAAMSLSPPQSLRSLASL